MIAPAAAAALVPPLRLDGLRAAGLYPDAQTDDARLCLANLRGAADAGAAVLNRIELAGLERGPVAQLRDTLTGETFEVGVRAVVNAAGPWIDDVRRLEDAQAGTSVTLSRGAHLVLEREGGWGAAVTIPIDRTRVAFAVPWAGRLLSGRRTRLRGRRTRDRADRGGGDDRFSRRLRSRWTSTHSGAVRARFAGVRVLPAGAVATARAHRETMLSSGPLGMVSVAGGKLTTYRRIALAVLHAAPGRARAAPDRPTPAAAAGRRGSRRRGRRPPASAHGARPAARGAPGGDLRLAGRGGDRRRPSRAARRRRARGRGSGALRAQTRVGGERGGRPASADDARGHRTGLGRGPPSGRGAARDRDPRDRPGDDRHDVPRRRRRAPRRAAAATASSRSTSRSRAGSSTIPRRSGSPCSARPRRRSRTAGIRRPSSRRSGSRTSARRRSSGSERRGGRSHRAIVWQDRRTAERCRDAARRAAARADRPRPRPVLLGHEARMAARAHRPAARRSSPSGRSTRGSSGS